MLEYLATFGVHHPSGIPSSYFVNKYPGETLLFRICAVTDRFRSDELSKPVLIKSESGSAVRKAFCDRCRMGLILSPFSLSHGQTDANHLSHFLIHEEPFL